jgi:tetratricopeptide (TPR) repeat protein
MAGARQIAAQAQLSVNSTSALLKRLSARGATLVSERGKRGRLYYIAEPLLSMYYLTRQQRRPHPRLKALVQFMIKFYDPAPLTLGAEREELLTLERGYDDFLTIAQTFAPVPPAVAGQSNERPPLNPVPEKIQGKLNNIAELFNKSLQLIQAANYEPALAAFDQIIDQGKGAPEPLLQEAVARALINKGVILGKLGKVQAEGQVYDEVLDRFKAQTSPALLQATAFALFNKGANLGKQGKIEEELAIYDEVRRRFGPCQDPGLQEQVAFALFNKASTLGELGKFEDSLQTYGQLITGFARRTPPTLQQAVARAFVNQSIILKELGRYDDELSLYQQIIAQFALRSEPELWAAAAFALYHSGVALGNLHRPYDALNVFADFITRFGEYPDARRITARALFNQAVLLGKLKKLPEAVQAYDQLLENFSDSPDLELRALAARAYINRGAALGELGRMEDEIASYDEIIEKLHREPEYRAIVEMACIRKCSAFMRSHEPQKAEQALLAVKGQRSLALQSKLIELWAQNPQKQDDAIKLTEAVISQHPADFSENAAWFFYKQNLQLNKCAAWARQAAAEPDSPRALGALACIAAALGRRQEALAAAEKFMQKLDAHNTYAWLEVLLELFINLAALAPREALALLADSPAAGQMEPLLTALKMSNEQDARTAPEIYDVALDIATRIERTRNSYFESRL